MIDDSNFFQGNLEISIENTIQVNELNKIIKNMFYFIKLMEMILMENIVHSRLQDFKIREIIFRSCLLAFTLQGNIF